MIQESERHPWLVLEPLLDTCPQALTALSLRMSTFQDDGPSTCRWDGRQVEDGSSLCECTEWLQLEWLACACSVTLSLTQTILDWKNRELNYPSDSLHHQNWSPWKIHHKVIFHLHVASTQTLISFQCWRLADRKQLQELLYWVTSIKYTRTRHTRQCDGTEYTPQRRKQ